MSTASPTLKPTANPTIHPTAFPTTHSPVAYENYALPQYNQTNGGFNSTFPTGFGVTYSILVFAATMLTYMFIGVTMYGTFHRVRIDHGKRIYIEKPSDQYAYRFLYTFYGFDFVFWTLVFNLFLISAVYGWALQGLFLNLSLTVFIDFPGKVFAYQPQDVINLFVMTATYAQLLYWTILKIYDGANQFHNVRERCSRSSKVVDAPEEGKSLVDQGNKYWIENEFNKRGIINSNVWGALKFIRKEEDKEEETMKLLEERIQNGSYTASSKVNTMIDDSYKTRLFFNFVVDFGLLLSIILVPAIYGYVAVPTAFGKYTDWLPDSVYGPIREFVLVSAIVLVVTALVYYIWVPLWNQATRIDLRDYPEIKPYMEDFVATYDPYSKKTGYVPYQAFRGKRVRTKEEHERYYRFILALKSVPLTYYSYLERHFGSVEALFSASSDLSREVAIVRGWVPTVIIPTAWIFAYSFYAFGMTFLIFHDSVKTIVYVLIGWGLPIFMCLLAKSFDVWYAYFTSCQFWFLSLNYLSVFTLYVSPFPRTCCNALNQTTEDYALFVSGPALGNSGSNVTDGVASWEGGFLTFFGFAIVVVFCFQNCMNRDF